MKPTIKTKCHELWRGQRRHPWRIFINAIAAFGVLWTLTEGVTHFLPELKVEGGYPLTVLALISLGFGLNRVWKPSNIVIKVPTTDTRIEILFDDLFEQEGLRTIGVTEFFESELGVPVSETSLHGMFLKRYFASGTKDFDEQLKQQLKGITSKDIKKAEGKTKSYPIGSTACIEVRHDKYIFVAASETDPNTCKASSDIGIMWEAMRGLWKRARVEAGGHELNVPLIGSGLAGIGLPTRELLNLIILSVITATKSCQITQTIRIVLHPERFEEVALREVKKYWEDS